MGSGKIARAHMFNYQTKINLFDVIHDPSLTSFCKVIQDQLKIVPTQKEMRQESWIHQS